MTNKVQIGVDANVSGVESSLSKVEAGALDVSKGVDAIGKASEKASASLAKIEYSAKRLQSVAAILSKEFGKAFDPKQAEAFLRSFDSIRANKHVAGGSKLRSFDSFESWISGNSSMFVNPADAERYKRRVLGLAGQGIGLPMPAGGHGGHGGHGGGVPPAPGDGRGGFSYGAAASRGVGMVRGIAGPALALAGITSIMAMAGKAVDLAKQEATSTDQLLRKTGDLTTTFDTLRDKVRASGEGLGVMHTEASQLAKQFVQIANGDGGDIQGNLRTGFGLSRAYGLELGEGVGFMAQMRHYGQIGKDDANGRKFALLIAEAIERGQTTGKAGEMMQAVTNFTAQAARLALTPGNVAGFGGALAGLTSSGDIGLKGDPSNAAALLMSVDSAIRAGGGMGEAGLNFSYGALSRVMPGLDPIMAKAVLEQGAFGSGVSPAIQKYAQRGGIDLPSFSGSDNLSLIMDEFDRQYGNSTLKLDAMKNYFGLGSYSQAAALANLDRKQLTGLTGAMGDKVADLSASGIQNAARISIAGDDELKQIAGQLGDRSDFTDLQRREIKSKLAEGDMEGLREAMLRAVSINEQQKNAGTETRDAVNKLYDKLTEIGGAVLPIITGIQEGVAAMAGVLAPESEFSKQQALGEGAARYQAEKESLLADHKEQISNLETILDKRGITGSRRDQALNNLREHQAAEIYKMEREGYEYEEYLKNKQAKEAAPTPGDAELSPSVVTTTGDGSASPVQATPGEVGPMSSAPATPGEGGQVGPVSIKADELATLRDVTGGDARALDFLATALAVENRGFGELRHDAVSPAGAYGAFQIMPKTARGLDISEQADFKEQAEGAMRLYKELDQTYGGNTKAMLAHYNGGYKAGRAVMAGMEPPAQETRDYLRHAGSYTANLPIAKPASSQGQAQRAEPRHADGHTSNLPSGNPAGNPSPAQRVELRLEGMMRDAMHNQVADILPIQQTIQIPMAAGAR